MAGADQVGRALLSPYQQEGRQCSVSIGNHVAEQWYSFKDPDMVGALIAVATCAAFPASS